MTLVSMVYVVQNCDRLLYMITSDLFAKHDTCNWEISYPEALRTHAKNDQELMLALHLTNYLAYAKPISSLDLP